MLSWYAMSNECPEDCFYKNVKILRSQCYKNVKTRLWRLNERACFEAQERKYCSSDAVKLALVRVKT